MIGVVTLALIAGLVAGIPYNQLVNIKCATEWFDRDDACGSGDFEVLSLLRKENPGKICPVPVGIETRTFSGQTPSQVGDKIYKNDPKVGFICLNKDQQKGKRCSDYRVRFICHPPFCGVCWTRWFDRDNPSGSGDWEMLSHLNREHPNQICISPLYMEAVTTASEAPASSTGEVLRWYGPTIGFACVNSEQRDRRCMDYKVRFGCLCQ